MLAEEVLEHSTTEGASPIVFAPKKDGSLRFCIKCGKLNAVTIRDSYPLPGKKECNKSLGDATVFSTLDASSGYLKIKFENRD